MELALFKNSLIYRPSIGELCLSTIAPLEPGLIGQMLRPFSNSINTGSST